MVLNNPFKINNEISLQQVVSEKSDMAGIVFYKAGKSNAFGGIEVDQPCLVMLKKSGDDLQVSISDPTQLLDELNLTIAGTYSAENSKIINGKTKLKIVLPQNGEAGKTVIIKLKNR